MFCKLLLPKEVTLSDVLCFDFASTVTPVGLEIGLETLGETLRLAHASQCSLSLAGAGILRPMVSDFDKAQACSLNHKIAVADKIFLRQKLTRK